MSCQAGWPSRSRRTSCAYHLTLSGLSASTDTTARMSADSVAWGQASSLTLIRPWASGASRRPARSAQFASGRRWAITIEHDTTPATSRTLATACAKGARCARHHLQWLIKPGCQPGADWRTLGEATARACRPAERKGSLMSIVLVHGGFVDGSGWEAI